MMKGRGVCASVLALTLAAPGFSVLGVSLPAAHTCNDHVCHCRRAAPASEAEHCHRRGEGPLAPMLDAACAHDPAQATVISQAPFLRPQPTLATFEVRPTVVLRAPEQRPRSGFDRIELRPPRPAISS